MRIVLKIGGNEIDAPAFLDKVASLVSRLREERHSVVLVHGGGKEITALLDRIGIQTRFVDGMRYTDAETLAAVEMMLSGSINKRLVRTLQQSGISAIGLSGVDAGILSARKITRDGKDIGEVGEVSKVNIDAVERLAESYVLVLSPISAEEKTGHPLNVNADYAAAAVASFMSSELIIFLSNVPGVVNAGEVVSRMNEEEFLNLKSTGVISGGMVPKIEAALKAVRNGAKLAYITDAEGAAVLASGREAGTQVQA